MVRRGPEYVIVPYHVLVTKKYARATDGNDDRHRPMSNFDGEGADLLHEFSAFISGLPSDVLVERDERHFGQPSNVERKGRTLRCRVTGGSSGIDSNLYDRARDVRFTRTISTVEESPFRLMFVAPAGSALGYLMVEGYRGRTLNSAFRAEFVAQFGTRYPDYAVVFESVGEAGLWQFAERLGDAAGVKQMEVVHREMDADTAQSMGLEDRTPLAGNYTETIQAERGEQMTGEDMRRVREAHWKSDQLKVGTDAYPLPNRPEKDGVEWDGEVRLRDDITDISARVGIPGVGPRTVRLSGKFSPRVRYEVESSGDSEPSDTDLYSEAILHVRQLAEQEAVTLEHGWNEEDWDHPEQVPTMHIPADDPQGSE